MKFNLTESHKGSSDATAQITFDPKKVLAISGCQSVWEGTGSGRLQIQVNGSWIDCTNNNGFLVTSDNYSGGLSSGTRLQQWINNKQYVDVEITGARYYNGWADGSQGVIAIFNE